jgi:hypothetical protein
MLSDDLIGVLSIFGVSRALHIGRRYFIGLLCLDSNLIHIIYVKLLCLSLASCQSRQTVRLSCKVSC